MRKVKQAMDGNFDYQNKIAILIGKLEMSCTEVWLFLSVSVQVHYNLKESQDFQGARARAVVVGGAGAAAGATGFTAGAGAEGVALGSRPRWNSLRSSAGPFQRPLRLMFQ